MKELYNRFKDNIYIHWGTVPDYVRAQLMPLIIDVNGKSYAFGKEILGIQLK